MTDSCPCGSGRDYAACCGPLLDHGQPAPTAEALMRSRYAAYARNQLDYLEKTQLSRKRNLGNLRKTAIWNADVTWTGLRILATSDGGPKDSAGVVEFTAAYSKAGEAFELHEISRFKKQGGRWFYLDGRPGGQTEAPKPAAGPKVGRNEPCPCGSGKKYKRCCGAG